MQIERCVISEYHVVKTQFKDKDVLIKTLESMGYKAQVHDEAKNLHGYKGDKREQKAHIIIPRDQVGAASNDVGFEKVNGVYVMHASEFDTTWRTGEKIKELKKSYAENKLRKTVSLTSNCSIISRTEKQDGKIEIKLRWM